MFDMPERAAAIPAKTRVTYPEREGGCLPLRVRGLTFERAGRRLIDNVSLDISAVTVTMILGPNGAGKSLLLRLLHGLLEPTSGTMQWGGGEAANRAPPRQAMVFQQPVLLRRSVAANLDFALRLRGQSCARRREALLARVGLSGRERQPARLLSGGEQQRLALARALAMEPEVLFLDEPTASLDPVSVEMIEGIVKQTQAAGAKTIFVSHDIAQAHRLAGDIVFLRDGRVVDHCSAGVFFARGGGDPARAYFAGAVMGCHQAHPWRAE